MAFEYDTCFKPGSRLILELKSKEIYEGIYADGGKDRIVLSDVVQHNNKNKLGGLYEFYRTEIAEIRTLKLKPEKVGEIIEDRKPEQPELCRLIKICEEDYFRLKETCKNYTFIEYVDKQYFDAVNVLKDAETVGVVPLGMEKNRMGSYIRLLVLCTWKHVFIFDLMRVEKRQLYPEIKDILESEYICKVIHKSAGLVDILFRHYNVNIQNVFDTQIVDLMLQKKETGNCLQTERDLSGCLEKYLNVPPTLLKHALEVPTKKWNDRPLHDKLKLYASQLGTYLIVLKEHFQKLLLKNVYDTISRVHNQVYNFDDFEFLHYVSKKEVPKKIHSLIP